VGKLCVPKDSGERRMMKVERPAKSGVDENLEVVINAGQLLKA
jgi:hypothetical protein